MMRRVALVRVLAASCLLGCGAPLLASAKASGTMRDCFVDLERGSSANIVCEFPLQPSQAEREELAKQTSGYLKDVQCTVSIRIERSLIATAIATPDYLFQAPPQPVACNVTMPGRTTGATTLPDQTIPITGTFAPKVTIKDGVATQATPGLANVQGVSRIISLPVVAYVNRAGFLREGMLKTVNAWMGHMRQTKARAG